MRNKITLSVIALFCLWQGILRYFSRQLVNQGERRYVYREFDPRGLSVETFRKKTEREYYKVKGHFIEDVSLPGLEALDFSVTWLRILASTYDEASVEGDFSWLFHKLRFISNSLPQTENSFQSALMPFFVVLGKDPAGALFLLNEKMKKFKTDWRISYWAGFHALENLKEKKLAGSLFLEASKFPGAPEYLTPLGLRLMQGDETINFYKLRKFATENLDPELLERLKRLRPEWFTIGESN
jgi:hypothetical protein